MEDNKKLPKMSNGILRDILLTREEEKPIKLLHFVHIYGNNLIAPLSFPIQAAVNTFRKGVIYKARDKKELLC